MRRLPQSTTYRITFKAFLTADHSTAATGKTIAVVISKSGGAFANPSAGATNATEVSVGWYYVDLSTTDTNTLGDLAIRATEATIDPAEQIAQVVSATTGGATNLDVASSTLATAANLAVVAGYIDTEVASILADTTAIKAKTNSLTFTVAGQADSNIQYVNGVLVTGNGSAGTPWGP